MFLSCIAIQFSIIAPGFLVFSLSALIPSDLFHLFLFLLYRTFCADDTTFHGKANIHPSFFLVIRNFYLTKESVFGGG